jgi:hypothetical protein
VNGDPNGSVVRATVGERRESGVRASYRPGAAVTERVPCCNYPSAIDRYRYQSLWVMAYAKILVNARADLAISRSAAEQHTHCCIKYSVLRGISQSQV